MILEPESGTSVRTSLAHALRRRTRLVIAAAAALVLGLVALTFSLQAHATPQTGQTSFGTLDTQPATAAAEAGSSDVSMAMLEFNWGAFEPSPGVFSASYLATMKSELAAYQAAGMKVTLGLGLQNPPAWVLSLRLGQLVRRRPRQRDQLADADPVRPRLQRLLRDRHARLRHPPRQPGPDRAGQPVQRRHHRRREACGGTVDDSKM